MESRCGRSRSWSWVFKRLSSYCCSELNPKKTRYDCAALRCCCVQLLRRDAKHANSERDESQMHLPSCLTSMRELSHYVRGVNILRSVRKTVTVINIYCGKSVKEKK